MRDQVSHFFPITLFMSTPTATYTAAIMTVLSSTSSVARAKNLQRAVDFGLYNLANLGYRENSFNIIYCISVLEHASNHGKIIEQFERVLEPNGLLIATFDISLEDREKSTKETQNLLNQLNSRFNRTDFNLKTLDIGDESEILNTRSAKDFDRNSLPWALTCSSMLSSLAKLEVLPETFSFSNGVLWGMEKDKVDTCLVFLRS